MPCTACTERERTLRNLITDVAGLAVGNAEDARVRTGVTVLLAEKAVAAAVDVRGGAPGTAETDALDPNNLVGAVDAVVLSGGSVYGLETAGAVIAKLGAQGRGVRLRDGAPSAPIVPAAILFDLANGGDKNWRDEPPYRRLALEAMEGAKSEFTLGNSGAGFGAQAGIFKGGLGSASLQLADGIIVGALVAANAFGSPVIPGTGTLWAFPFERDGELGRQRVPEHIAEFDGELPREGKAFARMGHNTSIGIVATDAQLMRGELKRIAIMAQDGYARAVRPIHTPFDGDVVFALSTARRPLEEPRPLQVARIGQAAADCATRALARGIYEAASLGDIVCYREAVRGKPGGSAKS